MKKIFIIDDDSTSNYLSGVVISSVSKDCEIISYTNPVTFLASLKQLKIDQETILLLDLNMPQMDGWEFMNQFEKMGLECQFFILTSSFTIFEGENVKKYPFVKGFVKKPLTKKDVEFILGRIGFGNQKV